MSKINWHRLFGLTLMDLFTDSNYQVELEKELSTKKQYLDVALIRRREGVPLTKPPVGLEPLSEHNLLTYKSLHEPLDDWALEELIGYYTNYRKLVSPSLAQLLPAKRFQLYAVTTRYPTKLLKAKLSWQPRQAGVIELSWGTRLIRLIISSQVSLEPQNAFWLLFSGQPQGFTYGDQHYHWRHPSERALLQQLYELYQREGVVMPYTMADFEKDFTREHLHLLPPAERLRGLPPEERLRGLPPEERLRGLPAAERLKGLSAEIIFQQFPTEERLKGLSSETLLQQVSPAEIAAYLAKLTKNQNH